MILKSDADARVFVPVARQVELVREFERSGSRLTLYVGKACGASVDVQVFEAAALRFASADSSLANFPICSLVNWAASSCGSNSGRCCFGFAPEPSFSGKLVNGVRCFRLQDSRNSSHVSQTPSHPDPAPRLAPTRPGLSKAISSHTALIDSKNQPHSHFRVFFGKSLARSWFDFGGQVRRPPRSMKAISKTIPVGRRTI